MSACASVTPSSFWQATKTWLPPHSWIQAILRQWPEELREANQSERADVSNIIKMQLVILVLWAKFRLPQPFSWSFIPLSESVLLFLLSPLSPSVPMLLVFLLAFPRVFPFPPLFRNLPSASSRRDWKGTFLGGHAPLRRPNSHRFRRSHQRCRPTQDWPHRDSGRHSVASLAPCKERRRVHRVGRPHQQPSALQPLLPMKSQVCRHHPGSSQQGNTLFHEPFKKELKKEGEKWKRRSTKGEKGKKRKKRIRLFVARVLRVSNLFNLGQCGGRSGTRDETFGIFNLVGSLSEGL